MPTTYDEIARRIPLWLYAQNRDLVNEMPAVTEQAHEQLINVMDHDLFRTLIPNLTLTEAEGGVLDLSTQTPRILEVRSIRINYRNGDDDWTPLQRRDLEMLTMLYARNRPNRPLYYAEYNGPLVMKAFPAPREDYSIEITANVEPPVISPANQTNIITEQFPRAMEKAVFRQAALFQKSWEDATIYEKEMMSAVTEANAQTQRRRRDETETKPVDTANVMGQ